MNSPDNKTNNDGEDVGGVNRTDVGDHLSDCFDSLALIPQLMEKYETRFYNISQSELYKPAGMVIPKLPMYHPYHPFRKTTNDDILQVPFAMVLPNNEFIPNSLKEKVAKYDINVPITTYIIVQTLPYEVETEVICRYQYAMFPQAKGEMKGHESIWSQSIIYDNKGKDVAQIPATQIKIYESDKSKDSSPAILCGDSMRPGKEVGMLKGESIWSLVLGSHVGTRGDSGLFTDISHAFFGYTYFLPDGDSYRGFLRSMKSKSVEELVRELLDRDTCEISSLALREDNTF